MNEKELKNNNESTDIYNIENITKIFENQRVTLNKDIIFLKEDILKDFKRIETNLNLKFEKQNSNITNKIHKFESSIEAMKSKIEELSSLISTSKSVLYIFNIPSIAAIPASIAALSCFSHIKLTSFLR